MSNPYIISFVDDDSPDLPQYVCDYHKAMFKWTFSRYHSMLFTDDDVFMKCMLLYGKNYRTLHYIELPQPDIDTLLEL